MNDLTFLQLDANTYTAHAEGVGVVYWIHRSAQWGYEWQAFTVADSTGGYGKPGPDRPIHRPRQYRVDLFEAVRVYWSQSDRRNPALAEMMEAEHG